MARTSTRKRTNTSSPKRPGWVYVLTNPAMCGDLVKIGRTTREPALRARELSSGTGVPAPFEVAHAVYVDDCYAVERAVHRELKAFRVNKGREFFRVSIDRARRTIASASGRRSRRWLVAFALTLLALGGLAAWAFDAGLLG